MTTRGLFEQAFEEFKVTRQVSTGNGGAYVAYVEFHGRVPGAFIRDELGYDGPIGTRLYQMPTQAALDVRHQRLMREEEARNIEAPDVVVSAKKQVRETRASRRAKLEQLEARALANRYTL